MVNMNKKIGNISREILKYVPVLKNENFRTEKYIIWNKLPSRISIMDVAEGCEWAWDKQIEFISLKKSN